MATKARAMIQTMWRNSDPFDCYWMVGVGSGTVVGIGTGVVCVLQGDKATESAVYGLMAGGLTTLFWPAACAYVALFMPLKILEKMVRKN